MRTVVDVGDAGRAGLFIHAMVRQESRDARTSFLTEGRPRIVRSIGPGSVINAIGATWPQVFYLQ